MRPRSAETNAHEAAVAVHADASAFGRDDRHHAHRRAPRPEQRRRVAGRQAQLARKRARGRRSADDAILGADGGVREPAGVAVAGRLHERLAAIHVYARALDVQLHERQRAADLEPVRHAVGAEHRHRLRADPQRQRLAVER
jgi:hypothetical protein